MMNNRLVITFAIFLDCVGLVCGMPPDGSFFDDLEFSNSSSSQPIMALPDQDNVSARFNQYSSAVQIVVWDVRQGSFTIIKNYATKSIVVVDCGSSNFSFKNFVNLHMKELIDLFNGCRLAAIIITHPDADHYSFLKEGLLQFLKANCHIGMKSVIFLIGGGSTNQLCEEECKKAITALKITEGEIYSCDILLSSFVCRNVLLKREDTDLEEIEEKINLNFFGLRTNGYNKFLFCWPIFGIKTKAFSNDQSLVFALRSSGANILFTGDATAKTLLAIGYDIKSMTWVSAPQKKCFSHALKSNYDIICNSNFVIIPHHGAHTDGSDEVLSAVINEAKTNFVGAVVSANPEYSGPGHPTKDALTEFFPLSAQQIDKMPLVRHHQRGDQMHQIRTHRILFMPCLLPGGFLWLKLENGLSLFKNKKGSFFPYSFKVIHEGMGKSVYYYAMGVIYPYINNIDNEHLPDALEVAYQIILSVIASNSESLFWNNQFEENIFNDLSPLSQALLFFVVHLIADCGLSRDELIIKQCLMNRYGISRKKYNFQELTTFLFNVKDPAGVNPLSSKEIQYIRTRYKPE